MNDTAGDRGAGAAAPHELEAKVSAFPGFRLPDLCAEVPWVVLGPADEQVLDARYFDAADLRLIRLGITFRHRTGEDGPSGRWTLKFPTPSEGVALDRLELEEVGDAEHPPPRLIRLLTGVLRGAPLEPVARLQTNRTRIPLADPAERPLGTLADDVVSAYEGDEVGLRFREIEVELAEGAPTAVIDAVVAALRAAGAGDVDSRPKLARALGPRATAPPDPDVPEPTPRDPARQAFRHAAGRSALRLFGHDPLVRLDAGDEGIHQARVAARRLRSDLRTFRPVLDAEATLPMHDELKWLGGLLGAVRDDDVLAVGLAEAIPELDLANREGGVMLIARLERQRREHLDELLDALDSSRYVELTESLVRFVHDPPLTAEADRPARELLPELAARPWRHLVRNVAALPKEPADEQLHRVRILAKRARYAAELAAPAVPAAAKHASAIAAVQTVLGDHQDAVVAEHWLRGCVTKDVAPPEAFAAGLLVAVMRRRSAESAAKWPGAWKRADRKKLRGWIRT